jgi:hypothetical protein
MEGGTLRIGAPPEICGRSALARRPYSPMPMGQCRTDRMRAEPDPVRGSSGSALAELSFAAPAQPFEVNYFVEVVALEAASFRSAFTGYANRSAILVRLPQRPLPDYVPSAWKYISVH